MADFQKETQLFDVAGLNLTKPVDRLAPGEYRILNNTRNYGQGRLQGRQGITLISTSGTTGSPAHSLYTLDDPIPSPSQFPGAFTARTRLLGSGTTLLSARAAVNPQAYAATVNGTGYSGRPMSFVASGSDQNERPWVFVGDFTKLSKTSSAGITWQWGVAPPNFAPTIAIDAANPDGPDIGDSPNPYIYAFRARTDPLTITGCFSNLGPPVKFVNGLSPSSSAGAPVPPSNILITLPQAHPDQAPAGQVTYIDVFRWGGSLPIWLFIGTMQNIAGSTMIDTFSDADIAANEQANLDDNQPFMSVDGSLTGTATITQNGALGSGLGSTMTITAGDTLRAYNATGTGSYYVRGNPVTIAGQVYTFYASPDTTTTVQLVEDSPVASFSAPFLIPAPEMARQALPCVWGPFGGGLFGIVIFAVGDPARPGALYWTKGNSPESHPTANVLEITSAAEPLMNGILFNGRSYVLSDKRMWEIIPTLGQLSDFSALEIPNSKGLFARWGICVTPAGIAFVGKDGIYITNGGEPVSITDEGLYPIFPQESQGDPSGFPIIDGLTDAPFPSPDFDNPDKMRLAYGDGFLYFTYLHSEGTYKTLVYCFEQPKSGWISVDSYTPNIICQYFEQVHDETVGGSWNKMTMGSLNGKVYEFGGDDDDQVAISGRVRTASWDTKDPRPRKLWGDVEIDMDGECDTFNVQVGMDNYSYFTASATAGTNLHGRHRVITDINAGLGQYGYNLGLDIQWTVSTAQPILYFWVPTFLPKPELTALRTTDWLPISPDGAPRFVQGFRLHADTLNQTRTVDVLSDGGVVQQAFSILHPNEQTIEYWFTTPFITHLGRLLPKDAKFWRIFDVEWISEPAPPLAAVWETQETTHDVHGYFHHRAALPALISFNDPVSLICTINGDGQSPYTYTIPAGNGLFLKPYIVTRPMKGREIKYRLESICPFRLFVRDTEMLVKEWGSSDAFLVKRPFGALSREMGATI